MKKRKICRTRSFPRIGWILLATACVSLPLSLHGADPNGDVLWRENFSGGWIDAENPGQFTGEVNGRILGGLPNGPAWEEDGQIVSHSAGLRIRTDGDGEDERYVHIFSASQPVPEEARQRGVVSLWIRPSSNQGIVLGSLLNLEQQTGEDQWRRLTGLMPHTLHVPTGFIDISNSGAIWARHRNEEFNEGEILRIPADEWCLLWLAYDQEEGIAFYAQSDPDAKPRLISEVPGPSGGEWSVDRIRLFSGGKATRGHFAGRIGPMAIHRLEDWSQAGIVPVNDRWPDNLPITWTVSPEKSDHDLSNRVIGGWDNLREAALWQAVLPRANHAWTDAEGNPAGYETLTDAESKKQWWLDWKKGKYQPMGDRIEFRPGIYRATGGLPIRNHGGIHYTLVEGAEDFSADIRGSEPLTGDWVQPEPEKHPRVWRYEGERIINRHVWGRDWQSFTVFRTADGAEAAIPAMDARPWAAFTDPDGVTYVSLPDGVTPDDIGPLEGARSGGFNWNGAWLGKLLIQATARYNYNTDKGHGHTFAAYALGVNAGPFITIIEGRGLRCAKHPAAFTGGGEGGLCIWHRTDVGFDPPGRNEGDDHRFGVGTGSFTPFVDYSSRRTSVEEPGSVVTIYDEVTYREPTEPGDGTSHAKPARRAMYYAHGSRGNAHMFERVIVRNPVDDFFREPAPKAGVHDNPDGGHTVTMEVIVED